MDLPSVKVVTNKGVQLIPGGSLQIEPHPEYGEVIATAGIDCRKASLQECLTFMRPMCPESAHALEVTLKKAGTLAAAIPEDLRLKVTRLKVSGKIQGQDVALLRRMATEGMLMDLDRSDARNVANEALKGTPPFLEVHSE